MKTTLAIIALAASAFLTACGGGGGPQTAGPDNSNPSGIAEDVQAFEFLNAERNRCGFFTLTRKTELDTAAKAHADWMLHAGILSHIEDQAQYPIGFTGGTVFERVLATNAYSLNDGFYVFEALSVQTGLGKNGEGVNSLHRLLNAPYHSIGLLDGYRDIGVAVRNGSETGLSPQATYAAYLPGRSVPAGKQLLASNAVATYPCEGSTGVANKLTNESPNPVPGRDLAVTPLGVTISVKVRDGQDLAITGASLIEMSTGASVPLRTHVGGANGLADPQHDYDNSNVFISADVAMKTYTSYKAVITGTNNGAPFTREFVFTTGTTL